MVAFPRASLLAIASLLVACERPVTSPSVAAVGEAVAVTSDIVLNEPGYRARVIAEGLNLPQGTVQLGNGLIFVNPTGTPE